jgi:chromosome segregation ATPase
MSTRVAEAEASANTHAARVVEAEASANTLAARVAEAEANLVLAQSKIEGQNLELQSWQAGLLDAGETIKSLTARVAQAEANSVLAQSKIKSLNVKLQNEQASCVAAKLARNKAQADCGRLRRELDSVAKPSETPLEPVAVGSATSLLAATFSF